MNEQNIKLNVKRRIKKLGISPTRMSRLADYSGLSYWLNNKEATASMKMVSRVLNSLRKIEKETGDRVVKEAVEKLTGISGE